MVSSSSDNRGGSAPTVFFVGVVVGGIGGGLAGWLLGGHVAPFLTGVISVISRNGDTGPVRFEAMQQ